MAAHPVFDIILAFLLRSVRAKDGLRYARSLLLFRLHAGYRDDPRKSAVDSLSSTQNPWRLPWRLHDRRHIERTVGGRYVNALERERRAAVGEGDGLEDHPAGA